MVASSDQISCLTFVSYANVRIVHLTNNYTGDYEKSLVSLAPRTCYGIKRLTWHEIGQVKSLPYGNNYCS